MSASIKLHLSNSDCLQLSETASHIFNNCQATNYNNVKQLFTRNTPPPSQTILRANFNNYDIFQFPFFKSVPVEWKVKLRTVSDGGTIKHTHYASFNPSRLKLENAQITDCCQIKWDIDLVEYTTSYGINPIFTGDVKIRTIVFGESLSMIHPTPTNPCYESKSHAAMFDYCFQPQRSQTGVLHTTFRPQNNTILSLNPTDVQQLPLAPLDPTERLDLLSRLHKPPTDRRRSPPRYGSQYRDSRDRSRQPSVYQSSQPGQGQPHPHDPPTHPQTSRQHTPHDNSNAAPSQQQRGGSANAHVNSGTGPPQPGGTPGPRPAGPCPADLGPADPGNPGPCPPGLGPADPGGPGPSNPGHAGQATLADERDPSQEPPPLSTVNVPMSGVPSSAPSGPQQAPQTSQVSPQVAPQPYQGPAHQSFYPAHPTAGWGDSSQDNGASSNNANDAVQNGHRVTFDLINDRAQQLRNQMNNFVFDSAGVNQSASVSDIPVTNINVPQTTIPMLPAVSLPGVSEMLPQSNLNAHLNAVSNSIRPGQVWLQQPPILSQGQGYVNNQHQQPAFYGQQQPALGGQNWGPQQQQQQASPRMSGYYVQGPSNQQGQRLPLPPPFQGNGSVRNPPPSFQGNGGASNSPPLFQGNAGGNPPPLQGNGGANSLYQPGGNNQVNNLNEDQYRNINNQMYNLHSDAPRSSDLDSQDDVNSSNDSVANKKKKHRGGVRKQEAKRLAMANANSSLLNSPGSNNSLNNNGSYVAPGNSQAVGPGLQQVPAALTQPLQPRQGAASQSVPSALELPQQVLQGLVSLGTPTIARIRHLLQGQVPADMMEYAVEVNKDVLEILAKIKELQARVSSKTINVQGVVQFNDQLQAQLERVQNAITAGHLGLSFNQYATDAYKRLCAVVNMSLETVQTQQDLDWSMELIHTPGYMDRSNPQGARGSTSQTAPGLATPAAMGSQQAAMGGTTPGTGQSTPAQLDEFMTPGVSSPVHTGPLPTAPPMVTEPGQGPAAQGGSSGSGPLSIRDEIALGRADYEESTMPQQIDQMINMNDVRSFINNRDQSIAQSTTQRTRSFHETVKRALQSRLSVLEGEERSRVAREQLETSQRNLAAGLNADGSQKTPANNHVAELEAEFSRASQTSMDTTDQGTGLQGPGASFQQQRQLAFASGSATGSPAAASTPMEVKAPVSVPSISQEISDLQSRGAQADLSNTGEVSAQTAPVIQAPGGMTPASAGAGAGAPSMQHAPPAPGQEAMGGGEFQPFDNSRSASYHFGQPNFLPLNVAPNYSGNNGSMQRGNESNASRTLNTTHPNVSRLCMNSLKKEIKSNNVSRRQLTPGPAQSAASSSTQQGIRDQLFDM